LRDTRWTSVDAVRQQVLATFPAGTRASRPEGGLVLWVQLPPGCDGTLLQQRAAVAGIEILPGELFSVAGAYRDCVRIACGHPLAVLQPAVARLARLASHPMLRARARGGVA